MKLRLLLAVASAVTFVGIVNACQLVQPDNFICGHRVSGDEATYCSGANEFCICETQRCAVQVPEEACASHLRYTFGDEDCVAQEHASTALRENTSKNLCPQESREPASCGGPGTAGACPTSQWCLCGARDESATLSIPTRQCVVRSEQCAATGWAWVYNGQCVEGVASASELVLRGGTDSVCPGAEPFPRTCGLPQGRNNQACASGEGCLCGTHSSNATLNLSLYTCVVRNPECDKDGGLGISDRDGRCLTGASSAEDLVIQQTAGATCPGADLGSLFPDAGTPTPPCGVPLDGGSVRTCGSSRACLCGVKEGSSAQPNVAPYVCVSGHPDCRLDGGTGLLTETGECVGGVPSTDVVLRFDGQGTCPGFDLDPYRPDAGTRSDGGSFTGGP
jgi:hypothetical protein